MASLILITLRDWFFILSCITFSFLDHFEETRFKEKYLVEKVGVQTQTCIQDPYNLSLRRVALGPNLYFRADGTVDQDPLHYWGYEFN